MLLGVFFQEMGNQLRPCLRCCRTECTLPGNTNYVNYGLVVDVVKNVQDRERVLTAHEAIVAGCFTPFDARVVGVRHDCSLCMCAEAPWLFLQAITRFCTGRVRPVARTSSVAALSTRRQTVQSSLAADASPRA